jgi:DNA-binding transcriptional LysR family regulator
MTITQLLYFVRVAETGHLTEAARELMVAQPSLTQSLQKLERELDFPLFERKGRHISLSREGEAFYQYARKVVEDRQQAEKAAKNIRQANKGLIRFAHTEPMPSNFIPELIGGFLEHKENKSVRIEADVAGTAKIVRELRADEIDFGFCSEAAEQAEDLKMYPLFTMPVILITASGDPLTFKKCIEPKDLIDRPCISYRTNSPMYRQIKAFWEAQGLEPDVRCRSSAVHISELVARGLGWAFAARTDKKPGENIAVLNMPALNMERTMYLAMRSDRKHGPAAERFMEYVLAYSSQYNS